MSFFSNSSAQMFFDYGPIPMDTDNSVALQSINSKANPNTIRTGKTPIPKRLKTDVWDFYVGEEKGTALCMCCSHEKIKASHFECGHVISEFNGGTICIENLRPICSQCNRSVGKKNMNEFMEKYGYELPNNWIGKEKPLQKNKQNLKNIQKEVLIIE